MLDIKQFKNCILVPILQDIGLHSDSAENLLVGTALIESNLKYIKQIPSGIALGVFQIEPSTYIDICRRIKPSIRERILNILNYNKFPSADRLISDLALSVCIARLKYYLNPDPLPRSDDIMGLARYWNEIYNTNISLEKQYLFAGLYEKYCL